MQWFYEFMWILKNAMSVFVGFVVVLWNERASLNKGCSGKVRRRGGGAY